MTGEQRLEACARLSHLAFEFRKSKDKVRARQPGRKLNPKVLRDLNRRFARAKTRMFEAFLKEAARP
jgi:hypothetical protein